METASKIKIDDLDTYLNGLRSEYAAVKNAIEQKYHNGIAEGSVINQLIWKEPHIP